MRKHTILINVLRTPNLSKGCTLNLAFKHKPKMSNLVLLYYMCCVVSSIYILSHSQRLHVFRASKKTSASWFARDSFRVNSLLARSSMGRTVNKSTR
jgi:hypothetical protein